MRSRSLPCKQASVRSTGKGNQPPEYTVDGGVKVLDLEYGVIYWEYRPGGTRRLGTTTAQFRDRSS